MSEPQPPNAEEVDQEPSSVSLPVNASAEDRKAAAALSSLDAPTDDAGTGPQSKADRQALDEAMSRLEKMKGGSGSGSTPTKAEEQRRKEEVKKKVKVDAADVSLLVCNSVSWNAGRTCKIAVLICQRLSIWNCQRPKPQSS